MKRLKLRSVLPGAAAGLINGLLGSGGGMVLIPLLRHSIQPREDEVFPMSVSIMLPICAISLSMTALQSGELPLSAAWPYLLGGAVGGIFAGFIGNKIPVIWLHRGLGMMIIWGGIRYLC